MNKAVGITCAALFVVGTVVAFTGLACANFDFKKIVRRDDYQTHKKTVTIDNQQTVSIDLTHGDITIKTDSTAEDISVSYYTKFESEVVVTSTDTEIKIEDDYNFSKNWYDIFQTPFNFREISIVIPEREYKNLDINITSGEVELNNITAGNLSVKMSSGIVNGSNLKGENLTIKQVSGLIDIKKCDFTTLRCDVTSGQTKIADATIPFTYFNLTSGIIKINYTQQEKYFSVEVNVTSGECNVPNRVAVSGLYSINGNVTSGSAKFYFTE